MVAPSSRDDAHVALHVLDVPDGRAGPCRECCLWQAGCNGSGLLCVVVVTRGGACAVGWFDGVVRWAWAARRRVHGRASGRFVWTSDLRAAGCDDFVDAARGVARVRVRVGVDQQWPALVACRRECRIFVGSGAAFGRFDGKLLSRSACGRLPDDQPRLIARLGLQIATRTLPGVHEDQRRRWSELVRGGRLDDCVVVELGSAREHLRPEQLGVQQR